MENKSPSKFYDDLSDNYHLIFSPGSWEENINKQSEILDKIIKKYSSKTKTILDCSCGIGTQSIGLAKKGYNIHATDLSKKAIKRAIIESKKRNLTIYFGVSDFRNLETKVKGTFDTVISCDNSLPHLLTNNDLFITAQNILTKMKSGSLFIGGIRDYDEILEEKINNTTPNVKDLEGERIISFQVWDWEENNTYTVNQFLLKGLENEYETFITKTKYRAYKRNEISEIFNKAGFCDIKWLMPVESGYHQPLMIAFKK